MQETHFWQHKTEKERQERWSSRYRAHHWRRMRVLTPGGRITRKFEDLFKKAITVLTDLQEALFNIDKPDLAKGLLIRRITSEISKSEIFAVDIYNELSKFKMRISGKYPELYGPWAELMARQETTSQKSMK